MPMPVPSMLFDIVRQDIAYAVRGLQRRPGFAAAIALTLALAIGANAAMFSLLDRLFLRPPEGVSDPARLRRLYVRNTYSVETRVRDQFDYLEFLQLDTALAPGARLAAYMPPDSVTIGSADASLGARAVYTTGAYFEVVGVRPALGRFFDADEDRMDAPTRVAILGDAFWRRVFGGERAIVGRTIELDDERYTIIGVAPPGFTGTDIDAADLWVPLSAMRFPFSGSSQPWYRRWSSAFALRVLAREAPGATDAMLASRGTTIRRRGGAGEERVDSAATVLVGPVVGAGPTTDGGQEMAIAARLGGVALIVLLVACANVANLLLARGLQRRREIAVRLALGISRRRLIAQLLTESVLVALLGGAAALVVGAWGGAALRATVMPEMHWAGPPMDVRVALFTLAATLITGLLAGLAPALQSSRPDLTAALRAGAREGAFQRSRLRASLLVGQAAASVILLAGAGFFVRSLQKVRAIDLGYDAEQLVFGSVSFKDTSCNCVHPFARGHEAELAAGYAAAAVRLRQLPSIENIAFGSNAPMYGFSVVEAHLPGSDSLPHPPGDGASLNGVSPEYFGATGMRLRQGRGFTAQDRAGAPPVLVVNERMARVVWPGENPLGKCVILARGAAPCYTVVGVVADGHLMQVLETPSMQYYIPLTQYPDGKPWLRVMIVRAAPGRASQVVAQVRRELRRAFPHIAPPTVTEMERSLAPQFRPWRLGALLFSAFGLLALVVAALGVYSVIAFTVRQRMHEMGVRVALGARALDVLRLVITDGLRTTAIGVAVGIAITLAVGRVIASLLYETTTHDPLVIGVVALTLFAAATLASLVPARWATRLDPADVLRAD